MYLVCYDIEDDKIRTRVAKILEGWGYRVQYSVFECDIDTSQMDALASRLEKALGEPENGSIRIYRICASCLDKSYGLGDTPQPENQPCFLL